MDYCYNDECQFLAYGESVSNGPWIKLRLKDPDDLSRFRSLNSSTRLACVLVEIQDDENPKPENKQFKLSQKAYMLTTDSSFQEYCRYKTQDLVLNFHDSDPVKHADMTLKYLLNINSKSQLDTSDKLGIAFKQVVNDFNAWESLNKR